MVYTANTPNAGDKISVTQPIILANFQDLEAYTQVDHVPLNSASAGFHKWSHYPRATGGAGVPTTSASDGAVFADVTANGLIEALYRYPTDAGRFSGVVAPLSAVKAFCVLIQNALPVVTGSSYNVDPTMGTTQYFPGQVGTGVVWQVKLVKAVSVDVNRILVLVSGASTGNPTSVTYQIVDAQTINIRRGNNSISSVSVVVLVL